MDVLQTAEHLPRPRQVVVLHAEPDFALLSAEALGAIAAFLRSWARWACLDEGISSFYPPIYYSRLYGESL